MKNTSISMVSAALALILAACFVACSLPSRLDAAASGGKATLTFSATSKDYDLGSGSGSARTILPSTGPAISGYVLYGTPSGGSESSLGTFASLSGASVSLASGSWSFRLVALDAAKAEILEGSASATLEGDATTSLAFVLEPLASGSGSVSVTLSWPSSVAVASVVTLFGGKEQSPALAIVANADGSKGLGFAQSGVAKGNYPLVFQLLDSGGRLLASVSEMVRVLPNMASSKTISLSSDSFNSAPAAPSGLTAIPVPNTTDDACANVGLSWTDNSDNETGFEIALADGTALASCGGASTSYTDTAVSRGTTRSYKIRAVNSFGSSAWVEAVAPATATVPYLVSFNSDGGSAVAGIESPVGLSVTAPTEPTKPGYAFAGWYKDSAYSTAWDFANDKVSGSAVLYAAWGHTLTYATSDGTGTVPAEVRRVGGAAVLKANAFAWSGYDFLGWATTADGDVAYADGASYTMGDADATLYAVWATSPSDLTYTTSGGAVTIKGYTAKNKKLIIPPSIGGNPVTAIASCVIQNNFDIISVSLPASLTSIGLAAFQGDICITSFSVSASNPSFRSVDGVLFRKDMTKLILFPVGKSDTSYTVPSTVTTIGAFAFYNDLHLTSIVFPEGLKTFEEWACASCKFTEITIPGGVTTIGDTAFGFNNDLLGVHCKPTTPPILGTDAFMRNFNGVVPICVPSASLANYQGAANWSACDLHGE